METMAVERGQMRGGRRRSRWTLVVLFLMFATPLAIAWLLNFSPWAWHPAPSLNHGRLIQPVRPLAEADFAELAPRGAGGLVHGRWTLVFAAGPECNDRCRQALYTMRQVRLAQGHNMGRVQRLLLLLPAGRVPAWLGEVRRHYPGLRVARMRAGAAPRLRKLFELDGAGRHSLFIVDPRANLMMRHDLDARPKGLIRDLQRLLKASYIG